MGIYFSILPPFSRRSNIRSKGSGSTNFLNQHYDESHTMRYIISTTILGMRLASVSLLIYWLMLFTATHVPRVPLPSFGMADKVYHFTAFVGLAALLAWALPKSRHQPRRHLLIAFGITVIYAIFDETTQMLVRGRSAELLDFAADSAGAIAGLGFYTAARRLISGSPDPKPELYIVRDDEESVQPTREVA